jgi:bifunctional N-acetylglucosamine-1-phosphate-uridyltransferase/glucosamine-1-phosphate-acetyltransferase GlmU-like protein
MPEIHDTALLRNVDIGDGSTVWAYSNLYDCVVGEDCLIGPYVELQRS